MKQLGIGVLVSRASPVVGQVLLAALPRLSGGVPGPQGIVDRAVGSCFFPLDMSKLVIPFLICICSVVGREWINCWFGMPAFIPSSAGLPALPLVSWQSW